MCRRKLLEDLSRIASHRRNGVTLLEVLVAIMVLSVGLLSLAALIPVGRHEMAEAGKIDRASALGRAAFRDLMVRGYLRPDMLLNPSNTEEGVPVVQGPIYAAGDGPQCSPPLAPLVLDPLMIYPESVPVGELEGHMGMVRYFPHRITDVGAGWPEGTVPPIARVTIRQMPESLAMMNYDTANRFFRSNDDLMFTTPTERKNRPIQVYHEGTVDLRTLAFKPRINGSEVLPYNVQPVFRQFQGDFSWFVVLSPIDRELVTYDVSVGAYRLPQQSSNPGVFASEQVLANARTAKQFSVAVVVCHKRRVTNLGASISNAQLTKDRGERMCWVDFLGEREARLRVSGHEEEEDAARALGVKPGEWIALIGQFSDPLLKQTKVTLQWYHIVASGQRPVQINKTDWYLDVKLDGRPWVTLSDTNDLEFSFDDASAFTYPDMGFAGSTGSELPTAWGVIVDDVVGVYEKTVTLDGRSLWSF